MRPPTRRPRPQPAWHRYRPPVPVHSERCSPPGLDTRPEANGADETARKNPDPGQTDRAGATRILNAALRIAQSITNEAKKASVLASVAGTVAATDPDRGM